MLYLDDLLDSDILHNTKEKLSLFVVICSNFMPDNILFKMIAPVFQKGSSSFPKWNDHFSLSNQFLMDKIKSWPTFLFVPIEYPDAF